MSRARRVLIIGAGWIGRRHLEAFASIEGVRVSVCETKPDALEAAASFCPEHTFGSMEEALTKPWDAAVISTPAHTHVALGRRLTAANVPVMVEKPLALSLEGTAEWLEESERRGVPVMVGFVFRCHPLLMAVRNVMRAGRIGSPLQLVMVRGGNLAARRPDYAQSYYASRERGGGVIHDILSHLYNAAEWLAGPIEVLAADAAHLRVPGVDVEDTVHVIARQGPVMATFAVNQHQPEAEFVLTINGTQGSLRAIFHEHRWQISTKPDAGWESHDVETVTPSTWFHQQALTFLAVADGARPPPSSLADAIVTLRATLATIEMIT